jgi:hypothetical protein
LGASLLFVHRDSAMHVQQWIRLAAVKNDAKTGKTMS